MAEYIAIRRSRATYASMARDSPGGTRSRYSRLSPMPYYSRCHRMDQSQMCFPGSPSGSVALLPLSSTTPSLCCPMLTNMLCR